MPNIQPRVEPFRNLNWKGMQAECVVVFNAQAMGIGGYARGMLTENVTHVVTVFDHLDGLATGDHFTVDSIFRPTDHMTVLDFDPQPFGVILYSRREIRVMVDPDSNIPVMVNP